MAIGSALAVSVVGCAKHSVSTKTGAPAQVASTVTTATPQVMLAEGGHSRFKLFAPERLRPPEPGVRRRLKLTKAQLIEQDRLSASVTDLALYIERMSGTTLELTYGEPPADARGPVILIGELAAARLGEVQQHALGKQAFRVAIAPDLIALYGESDLAASYAIYEVLDRLGCRWFMPGALGEVIPTEPQLSLEQRDETLAPATAYRDVWYADLPFKRRNRLGGVELLAGHRLERWLTPKQREEHPEWRAVVGGQPHPTRLRWSNPEVADAIAESIDIALNKSGLTSASLSPSDGVDFDESIDRKVDGNDWDPTMGTTSLTDRLLVLANHVAESLAPSHPDLTLGLLAYVSYSRPPVREHVHPSIVPVLAPITYCRPHPLSDDACPGATDLRKIVEGWSKVSNRLAFRSYAYNLAEPAAPNPMLRKWSFDLPFMFAHKVEFFQPETLANFETSLPALYLGIRLAWDTERSPSGVMSELFDRFYGHASKPARAYLDLIDSAWVDVPEFSGSDLGYERRFTPERLQAARRALESTKAACVTEAEKARVAMLDASLSQLELYMNLHDQLRSGNLATLDTDSQRWLDRARDLSEQYAENFAFGKAHWAGPNGVYGNYFMRFHQATYAEAARIAREAHLLTPKPLCAFRLRFAPDLQLPTTLTPPALASPDLETDVCGQTWSSLGHHDYFGAAWYQAELPAITVAPKQSTLLWLTRVDGMIQLWVNGQPVSPSTTEPAGASTMEAHAKPMTWDISGKLHDGSGNTLQIAVKRTKLAELGAGGLLGPVFVYQNP
jgi:hypothetical protein